MLICPNCFIEEIVDFAQPCASCDWAAKKIGGVLDFLSNQQRIDATSTQYNENYEELAQINIKKSNIDRTFLRRQARNLVDYLGDIKGSTVCEIGIGQGFLCEELLRKGVDRIVAVDVAISYLRQFVENQRVEPYLANAETLPFRRQFDLIVSTDVMEHVINVGSYLFSINRALVDGGRVAIRVPYKEGLLNYSPHVGYGHEYGHLRSFDKTILKIYMRQAGFRTTSIHLDGFGLGMPREWVLKSRLGMICLISLQKYVEHNFDHRSDVIDLPWLLRDTFFRSVEVVVIAEKVTDLSDEMLNKDHV